VYILRSSDDLLGIRATDSMAERFVLFIIIVLGEVVVGVVDGLRGVEDLDFRTVATGVLGLSIAFGFWWTYFDFVGQRLPRRDAGSLVATIVTLVDYRRLAALYRPLVGALLFGAVAALAIGWGRPAPWLLATLLDLILIAIWSFAFARSLRTTRGAAKPG
jgi:low temperature requirement protein LtrA